MKNTISVDGKLYQKTARFGNQSQKTVFKNHKKYNRKQKFKSNLE
jgi:hypothetical protein